MTICIAALYNNGKGIVFASDQMVTAHFPIGYEFENDEVEKIVGMCNDAPIHALISGDVLAANEIIEAARKDAESQGISAVMGIAELLRKAYQTVRTTVVVRNELEPRGLDMPAFYSNHQRLHPTVVQQIDSALATYNMEVELIIGGKGESKCGIYTIINPGQSMCNDPVGHSAIGSGAPHATYSLIESGYKKSMGKEAVEKLVREAKARSEVAPGVGKATNVIII